MRGYFFTTASQVIPNEQDEFGHTFGGPANHLGSTPVGSEGPLHLLYNLNLEDPRLGRKLKNSKRLPLYHPLAFDGATLGYQVLSDQEIQIFQLEPSQYELGWQYPEFIKRPDGEWVQDGPDYPPYFPRIPVRLEALSYEEQRAVTMGSVFGQTPQFLSKEDRELASRRGSYVRLGGWFPLLHPEGNPKCPNPTCLHHTHQGSLEPIISVGNEPVLNNYLWSLPGGHATSVMAMFRICRSCESILTYNICS